MPVFLPAAKPTGLVEADCSFFFLLTKFKKLRCLWTDLTDTLVHGQGRSCLPYHQVALKSATRVQPEMTEIFFIASDCSWASIKSKSFRILKIEWAKPELYIINRGNFRFQIWGQVLPLRHFGGCWGLRPRNHPLPFPSMSAAGLLGPYLVPPWSFPWIWACWTPFGPLWSSQNFGRGVF